MTTENENLKASDPQTETLCATLDGHLARMSELVTLIRKGELDLDGAGPTIASGTHVAIHRKADEIRTAATALALYVASERVLEAMKFANYAGQVASKDVHELHQKNETLTQRNAELELALIGKKGGAQ